MNYGNLKVPENATPEVQAILDSYEARNKEIENAHRKNMFRIGLGTALSGASAHPILNVPYVGTGLGGALYELGQGITEGDKIPELAKRTGTGFVIGETVGAIPYAGKYANKLSGGKIGNALTAGVEKIASTPLGQKVTEIAPKVEDLLMTDIKAFNPNKQTVYHGSPYEFNKFSNEAIGTGEGAQAHGYGHYAAKNRDVARDRYVVNKIKYENLPEETKRRTEVIGLENTKKELRDLQTHYKDLINQDGWGEGAKKDFSNKLAEIQNSLESLENPVKTPGQLYKLSIPKDDVMLREDLPFNQQPLKVQEGLRDYFNQNPLQKHERRFFEDIENPDLLETAMGGDLYRQITRNILRPDKNMKQREANAIATQILQDKGIKGISYNGGIDGEARVIFNPDDIEIVRKYYNQPSLYELTKKQKPFYGGVSNALYDYITGE